MLTEQSRKNKMATIGRPSTSVSVRMQTERRRSNLNLTMNSRTLNETACVLEIEGEIDVYTSPQLKQDIVRIAESGIKLLIISLAKVDYLDSTGLGVLIGGLKRLRESSGNVVIVGPSMRILRIFEITGIDKIFGIYATEDEAAEKEGVSL